MEERNGTEQVLIVVQHPQGLGRDDEPTLKQDFIPEHDDDDRDDADAPA